MAQINNHFRFDKGLFTPAQDYRVEFVEFTTFSLSNAWLAMIPSMIYSGEKKLDFSSLNHCLKSRSFQAGRYEERFHVFFDGKHKRLADQPHFFMTRYAEYALKLRRDNCTPVNPKGALFHPKIILVVFSGKPDGIIKVPNKYFRVIISSKNLTFSNYIEAGVILEGKPGEATTNETGTVLAQFFEGLYQKHPCIENRKIRLSADNLGLLKRTELKLVSYCGVSGDHEVKGIDSLKIRINGLPNKKSSIGKQILEELGNKRIRISSMKPNLEIFPKEQATYIANFKDLYEMVDKRAGTWEKTNQAKSYNTHYVGVDEKKPSAIHLKQYLIYDKNMIKNINSKVLVWIGSANCSEKGLGINKHKKEKAAANVEAMVSFISDTKSLTHPIPSVKSPNSIFLKDPINSSSIKYFNKARIDGIEDDYLDDVDGEDILALACVVRDIKYEQSVLSFEFENRLKGIDVFVRPALLPSAIERVGEDPKACRFTLKPKEFSNILIVTANNLEYSVQLDMDCESYGRSLDAIFNSIPLDPLRMLKDLIPSTPEVKSADQVFEKLLKLYISDDESIIEKLKDIDEKIKTYLNEMNDSRKAFMIKDGTFISGETFAGEVEKRMKSDGTIDEESLWQRYDSAHCTYLLEGDLRALSELIKKLKIATQGGKAENEAN